MATQDTSFLLSGLLQGQGGGLGALGGAGNASQNISQLTETNGENGLSPFVASLRESLQQLLTNNGSPGTMKLDAKSLEAAIEQLLSGKAANGGQGLPLLQGQGVAATDMEALLARLTPEETDAVAELLAGQAADGEQAAVAGLPGQADTLAAVLKQLKLALAQQGTESDQNPVHANVELSWTPPVTGEQPEAMDKRVLAERIAALANSHHSSGAQSAADVGKHPLQQLAQAQQQLQADSGNNAADSLLDSGQRLTAQQPAANVSPVMLERMMMNMGQERRAAADRLNAGDIQLDSLASLQGGQQGRPGTSAAVLDARPPVQQSVIPTPLSDPQWQQDFSSRVVMLAKGGAAPGQPQIAEIRLNPPHMGPVEVRVVMNDDQASVTFSAHHNAVRDAIETSLPRLREMFNNSGLQLADASVSDQSLQERQQRQQQEAEDGGMPHSTTAGLPFDEEAERIVSQINLATLPQNSALDLYA